MQLNIKGCDVGMMPMAVKIFTDHRHEVTGIGATKGLSVTTKDGHRFYICKHKTLHTIHYLGQNE